MVVAPAPSICAPIAIQAVGEVGDLRLARGVSITVVPRASTAAISRFSVAPTETNGNSISAPLRPPGAVAFT